MIIKGNVVFKKCPKTGNEGSLYRDCLKSADPKNKCPHFEHFGIEGHQIVITCKYPEYEQYQKDTEEKQK